MPLIPLSSAGNKVTQSQGMIDNTDVGHNKSDKDLRGMPDPNQEIGIWLNILIKLLFIY